MSTLNQATKNKTLHPNSLHNQSYDFPALISSSPPLAAHVFTNKYGNETVKFSDPLAVKALNTALLTHHYGIQAWDIPDGFLCPPIPGRADYIHYIADLLDHKKDMRLLDIGTGANGIYALLASQIYGWHSTATDIDPVALDNLTKVLESNPRLQAKIDVRLQANKQQIFKGIISQDDYFDVTVCNPPFHASLQDALRTNQEKRDNLAASRKQKSNHKSRLDAGALNFGGKGAELWCEGGENAFLRTMMDESRDFAEQCRWFTSLVSKVENVDPAKRYLHDIHAMRVKEIKMQQGNKITRILAWTFQ